MIRPVTRGRNLTGQGGQLALQEIAKRLAAGIDVLAVAIDEVHRHIEQIIGIALEAHAGFEGEGQRPGAAGHRLSGPDLRAVALEAARLAFDEGRVGEKRRGDRLQRQRDAQLLHHVGFVGEVEVDLHGTGAGHHVDAERAHLRHVVAHDLIAGARHPLGLVARPFRLEAHAEEADAELGADRLHLGEMVADLGAGLVDRFHRRAESSNWPPGSRLTLQPSLVRAMILPFSSIASHPKRVRPLRIAPMPFGPS